jgi:protein TonB
VSTVTNTVANAGETRSKESSLAARPNATAVEIPVNASGTRPKSGGTERELFSEDTETVLTFEDGALIRLLATVTPGQLIFLTNLVTKQEVVCEVLRKRLLRPAGCYVELRFTERKKGFWDVPAGAPAQPAANGTQVGNPSKKSLESLVSEVQELLATKPEPEETNSAGGAGPDDRRKTDEEAASANRAAAETTPVDQEEGKAARVEADDASEDLLPKPELDFSQVPAVRKHDPRLLHRPIPVVGATTRKLTWALLAVVLVGAGARYGHWIDFLSRAKEQAVQRAGEGESMTSAQSTQPGPKDAATKSEGAETAAATGDGTAASATTAAGGTAERPAAAAEKERSHNAGSQNAEQPSGRMSESSLEAANELPRANAEGARRGKSKTSATVQAEVPKNAEIAGEGTLMAAKLLKSVSPVYPPDAMRNFITGDVRAEVEVRPTGHPGEVKVLSGPASLREAAVEALKQYEFSPATRGGKAVPSKVVVTVKFWFNP